MTDEAILMTLASLRAQVGAMQAIIETIGAALEERVAVKQAVTECQHLQTEDWGSTLRSKRVRCMNPRCKKVFNPDEVVTGNDPQDRDGHSSAAGSAHDSTAVGAATAGK
jgi:hypothetical protein